MTPPAAKTPRPKTCSVCKTEFTPVRSLQKVCGPVCALAHAKAKESRQRKAIEKVERREIRVQKQRLKSRADHLRECQAIFNQWIRLRDAAEPCISCGRHHDGQYHAGHYRTVASAPELRFEPLNVWKQCAPCNNHKSGDIVNYRANLVQKLGAEKVEWLEGPHQAKRYTIEDLQAMKAHYRGADSPDEGSSMRGVLIRNDPKQITLEWNGGKEVLPTIKEAFDRSDQIKADPEGFGYEWLKTTGLIEEDEVCA